MMKSKSSSVSTVCILVLLDFDFFHDVGFVGDTFIFLYALRHQGGSVVVLLCLAFADLIFHCSLLYILCHHLLLQVILKQFCLMHYSTVGPLMSSSLC
jgi:hypothetical protein